MKRTIRVVATLGAALVLGCGGQAIDTLEPGETQPAETGGAPFGRVRQPMSNAQGYGHYFVGTGTGRKPRACYSDINAGPYACLLPAFVAPADADINYQIDFACSSDVAAMIHDEIALFSTALGRTFTELFGANVVHSSGIFFECKDEVTPPTTLAQWNAARALPKSNPHRLHRLSFQMPIERFIRTFYVATAPLGAPSEINAYATSLINLEPGILNAYIQTHPQAPCGPGATRLANQFQFAQRKLIAHEMLHALGFNHLDGDTVMANDGQPCTTQSGNGPFSYANLKPSMVAAQVLQTYAAHYSDFTNDSITNILPIGYTNDFAVAGIPYTAGEAEDDGGVWALNQPDIVRFLGLDQEPTRSDGSPRTCDEHCEIAEAIGVQLFGAPHDPLPANPETTGPGGANGSPTGSHYWSGFTDNSTYGIRTGRDHKPCGWSNSEGQVCIIPSGRNIHWCWDPSIRQVAYEGLTNRLVHVHEDCALGFLCNAPFDNEYTTTYNPLSYNYSIWGGFNLQYHESCNDPEVELVINEGDCPDHGNGESMTDYVCIRPEDMHFPASPNLLLKDGGEWHVPGQYFAWGDNHGFMQLTFDMADMGNTFTTKKTFYLVRDHAVKLGLGWVTGIGSREDRTDTMTSLAVQPLAKKVTRTDGEQCKSDTFTPLGAFGGTPTFIAATYCGYDGPEVLAECTADSIGNAAQSAPLPGQGIRGWATHKETAGGIGYVGPACVDPSYAALCSGQCYYPANNVLRPTLNVMSSQLTTFANGETWEAAARAGVQNACAILNAHGWDCAEWWSVYQGGPDSGAIADTIITQAANPPLGGAYGLRVEPFPYEIHSNDSPGAAFKTYDRCYTHFDVAKIKAQWTADGVNVNSPGRVSQQKNYITNLMERVVFQCAGLGESHSNIGAGVSRDSIGGSIADDEMSPSIYYNVPNPLPGSSGASSNSVPSLSSAGLDAISWTH